jgi:hypothetical protein
VCVCCPSDKGFGDVQAKAVDNDLFGFGVRYTQAWRGTGSIDVYVGYNCCMLR